MSRRAKENPGGHGTPEPIPPERTKVATRKNGIKIPIGVIVADQSAQAPNNSYCPPLYYEDKHFACVDCGSEEVWTAEQQWKYFELWKKPIYGDAVRCRQCQLARKSRSQ